MTTISGSEVEREWCLNAEVKVTVEKAIYGGKLMGSAPDGRAVWVTSAQPVSIGDRVKACVTKVAKRSFEVSVTQILEPSEDRVEPFCPMVDRCGGCPWQAISTAQQLESLERDIGRMLSRAFGKEVELSPSWIGDESEQAWRHTARLHIHGRGSAQNDPCQVKLGFFGPRGLFDLDHCPVFTPKLNEMLSVARAQISPVLGDGRAELRLSAARDATSGTFALSLIGYWREESLTLIAEAIDRTVSQSPCIHGATLEAHTQRLLVLGQEPSRPYKRRHRSEARREKRRGKRQHQKRHRLSQAESRRALTPASVHEMTPILKTWGNPENFHYNVKHPANAFMQAHQTGNEALIEEVVSGATGSRAVMELYAGSGNFTLALARADSQRSIFALEYDEKAVASLQQVAESEELGITACSQVIETLPDFEADHIILDPPRAGAASIVQDLAVSTADKITYISCHPAALARDLEILSHGGWRAEKIRIFHLFPHSGHAEVYCRLSRS